MTKIPKWSWNDTGRNFQPSARQKVNYKKTYFLNKIIQFIPRLLSNKGKVVMCDTRHLIGSKIGTRNPNWKSGENSRPGLQLRYYQIIDKIRHNSTVGINKPSLAFTLFPGMKNSKCTVAFRLSLKTLAGDSLINLNI